MTAYYNEIDKRAAAWLRDLIGRGLIAHGDVDERSVWDVHPSDLKPYTQCHFFAGIGVWSHALRSAGWPDDRPVWTGSCPCQPFSQAGKGRAAADDRHHWPAWAHLIRECQPSTVFGEQVEGKNGVAWLDAVQTDMEKMGYAFGPLVLPAAGFGAPHGRHRSYFVADAEGKRHQRARNARKRGHGPSDDSSSCALADTNGGQCGHGELQRGREHGFESEDGRAGELGHTDDAGREGRSERGDGANQRVAGEAGVAGWWDGAEWIVCTDGKARPVEPGTFPLVDGAPQRLVRIRGYGNAIVAPVATEFIRAYREITE